MFSMESTTLITFMLHHPSASFIELWGSWDNFAAPWEMKRDSRRGRGHWAGCHKFRNIICDGESVGFHEKRDGGLMMGGTYWYYYRIDDEVEHYDPSQPSTSSCPLLPGQYVNVLEVPWEKKFVSRSGSSSVAMITSINHTLNPDDRYRNPRPAPKPRLPKLMTKLDPASITAWSAAAAETPSAAIGQRQIKSATNAPINFFAAAMDRVPTPVSALFPARARTLRFRLSTNPIQPTGLPEHRITSPAQSLDKSQISYPIPLSKSSPASNAPSRSLPRGQDLYNRTVEQRRDRESLDLEAKRMQQPLHHRRTVTAREIRPVTQFIHRRTVSDETVLHKSPDVGRPRRSSISRKSVARQANFISNLDIPESITEVDYPQKVSKQEPQAAVEPSGLNLLGLEMILWGSEDKEQMSPLKFNLDKELPALPSYLVPSPLFSQTVLPNSKPADPSPFFIDWTCKESRFSAWTAIVEDYDSDTDGHDGLSSTFSDIQDSGHPSPSQLLDPFLVSSKDVKVPEDMPHSESQESAKLRQGDDHQLGSPEKTPLAGVKSRTLSNMDKLMEEFEYIGAELI